jgi:hypothetical protein
MSARHTAAGKLGLILLFVAPLAACAACKPGEQPLFVCDLAAKGQVLEVCATGSAAKPELPVTLRHSKNGKVVLEQSQTVAGPSTPSAPAQSDVAAPFLYSHYFRYQTDRTEVRMPRAAAQGGEVILYRSFEGDEAKPVNQAGLRMASGELVCGRIKIDRLGKLEALLACDPDSELGINACEGRPAAPAK